MNTCSQCHRPVDLDHSQKYCEFHWNMWWMETYPDEQRREGLIELLATALFDLEKIGYDDDEIFSVFDIETALAGACPVCSLPNPHHHDDCWVPPMLDEIRRLSN